MSKRVAHWIIALLVTLLTGFGLALAGVVRAGERAEDARREVDRQVCAVVLMLDEAYRAGTPSTPIGQELAARVSELRDAFHCD